MFIDRSVMICVGATTEVEALKAALVEAEGKAVKEQAACKRLKAKVNEVQQELQDAVRKCETLEHNALAQEAELAKVCKSAEVARIEAQIALHEIQEARKIAAGKAFNMQIRSMKRKFLLLTRIRSSPGGYADLPRSVSDAAEFFRSEGGSSTEKFF